MPEHKIQTTSVRQDNNSCWLTNACAGPSILYQEEEILMGAQKKKHWAIENFVALLNQVRPTPN